MSAIPGRSPGKLPKVSGRKPRRASAPASGPPPSEASLNEAALSHLARFGTTRAQLLRVLERRIERWARGFVADDASDVAAHRGAAREAAKRVVERLAASGAVDDAAFVAGRTRRLVRTGHSRRAIAAHMSARGVAAESAATAFGPDEAGDGELAAALATAQRRRAGPFRAGEADADARRKELAGLARAGFSQDVARRALAMDPDEAERLVERLKRG